MHTHMDANSKSLKSKLKKLHNVCEMEKISLERAMNVGDIFKYWKFSINLLSTL